jgi:hypothetical protein
MVGTSACASCLMRTTAAAVKNAARVPFKVVKRSDKVKCFVVLPAVPW